KVDEVLSEWKALTSHLTLVRPGEAASRPVTVPLVLDGRELWVSVSGVDFGEGTVYALQDVTDEHALEKTRSDFVATASHELRTRSSSRRSTSAWCSPPWWTRHSGTRASAEGSRLGSPPRTPPA